MDPFKPKAKNKLWSSVIGCVSFLDKERSIAGPTFNRWFIPPAALAIHLSIGMAYGFSVFWLPLSQAKGGIPCENIYEEFFTSKCDWQISTLVYTYSLFFFFLGLSAAFLGKWLERAGPRKAGILASILWPLGLVIGAAGIYIHQIIVLWFGAGIIGGIGLGIGYISPVSTLIKWFPDMRGLATGIAVMAFGGGAICGAPLAIKLMEVFSPYPVFGIPHTLCVLAGIFFIFMISGSLAYHIPPTGWFPDGSHGSLPHLTSQPSYYFSFRNRAPGEVHVDNVHKTPQFWLLWVMVLMNVVSGVGLVGMCSVMLQEQFGGYLIGKPDVNYDDLTMEDQQTTAFIGAGFVGFISIFNISGRFFWGGVSDCIGRKATYSIFFIAGAVIYGAIPYFAITKNLSCYTAAFCLVVSFYGGNFAALPAYLADLFGVQFVAAIHGRVLTTWMIGGILGPQLETYIRDYEICRGVARERAYDTTMYVIAGFLMIGLLCNLCITQVDAKYYMTERELDTLKARITLARMKSIKSESELCELANQTSERSFQEVKNPDSMEDGTAPSSSLHRKPSRHIIVPKTGALRDIERCLLFLAWACVLAPLCWGLHMTFVEAAYLFDRPH